MNDQTMAERIYSEIFDYYDKEFCPVKTQEIQDWLEAGSPEDFTLAELVAEWLEYDSEDIEKFLSED